MSGRQPFRWGHLTAVEAANLLALIAVGYLLTGAEFTAWNALGWCAGVWLYRLIAPAVAARVRRQRAKQ